MSDNKFEFSIVSGSDRKDAELDGMTLEVAEAFLKIIDAITKIVEASPNKNDLLITVKKGSVSVSIEEISIVSSPAIAGIRNDFFQSIYQTTIDKAVVEPWRGLQKLTLQNGLTYKSQFVLDGETTVVVPILKNAKIIKAKRQKNPPPLKTPFEFITGNMFQVGGKNSSNLHIVNSEGETLIIDCSKDQADKAKEYLYKDIFISTWVTKKTDKNVLTLCEAYYLDELPLFERMKNFFYSFENAEDEIDSLSKLHDECRYYLNYKEYGNFIKFLRLFNNDIIDISLIHTILILTISFKKHEKLGPILENLTELFNKKLNKLNKNNKRVVKKAN